jgi:hypothetical protein
MIRGEQCRKKRGNISFGEISTVENERALECLNRELEELEVKG